MVTPFSLFSRFAQTVVISLSAASLVAAAAPAETASSAASRPAAAPSAAVPAGPGSGSGSASIVVTVVGFACAGAGTSRAQVPQAALVDARQKGRDYAVSEIESKTTLESGTPRVDLMNAYANGTIRELGRPAEKWYNDPVQGDCCEVEVQLEAIPKAEEMAKMAAKFSPDDPRAPLTVQVWTDQKIYQEGEKFKVHLKANKPFYGTVVYQDAGGARVQLLPNPYRKQNFFAGNTLYELPDAEDKYELVVTPPLGGEKITVYASNSPLGELSTEAAGNVYLVTGSQQQNELRTRSIRFAPKAGATGTATAAEFFEASTELTTRR